MSSQVNFDNFSKKAIQYVFGNASLIDFQTIIFMLQHNPTKKRHQKVLKKIQFTISRNLILGSLSSLLFSRLNSKIFPKLKKRSFSTIVFEFTLITFCTLSGGIVAMWQIQEDVQKIKTEYIRSFQKEYIKKMKEFKQIFGIQFQQQTLGIIPVEQFKQWRTKLQYVQ